MLYTKNLNLKMPQPEDYAKIADLNENADKIDAAIANLLNKGVTFVTGTYTISSNNSPLTLDVGFTPDLVIIYTANNNTNSIAQNSGSTNYKSIPVILTSALAGTGYQIVENGFSANVFSTEVTQYYIAIKLKGVK